MSKDKELGLYITINLKNGYGSSIFDMSKNTPLEVRVENTFKEVKENIIKEVQEYLKEYFSKLEKREFLEDKENIKLEL